MAAEAFGRTRNYWWDSPFNTKSAYIVITGAAGRHAANDRARQKKDGGEWRQQHNGHETVLDRVDCVTVVNCSETWRKHKWCVPLSFGGPVYRAHMYKKPRV